MVGEFRGCRFRWRTCSPTAGSGGNAFRGDGGGGDLDGPDGHCARGCGGTVEAEVPKKEGISAKKKGTNRFAIVQRAEVSLTLNRLSHQTYVFP